MKALLVVWAQQVRGGTATRQAADAEHSIKGQASSQIE
jgi:hypothetical protein